MDGVLELVWIDIEADLLAADILGQRRIGVANQAIAVFGLLRGVGRTGTNKQ